MLDKYLGTIKLRINDAFKEHEQEFNSHINNLKVFEVEGAKQSNKIREIVDNYTEQISQNPNHIAYDLLDNDPLNDNSVECLCS